MRLNSSFMGLSDTDRGHPGGGGRLDADVGVLEDEAGGRLNSQPGGGKEEGVGGGLAVLVIACADQGVEELEKAEGIERRNDRFAGATGDDGEGNFAVLKTDLLEDLWDGLKLMDEVVVEAFLAVGELGNGDGEAVAIVELGDDVADGHAAKGVEELFGKVSAVVLGERLDPCDVVKRHGVGNGAVAVEEIGLEVAFGKDKGHSAIVSQVGWVSWARGR
jgi:hypothetical protein